MLGLSALPRGKMYQAATTEPKLVASMHAVFGIECQNVSHRRATTYALQASEGVVPIDRYNAWGQRKRDTVHPFMNGVLPVPAFAPTVT